MKNKIDRCLCIFILSLCLFPLSLKAQSADKNQIVDSTFFNGMDYRLIGPYRGGRVTAVEGIPSKPSTFFMGSTGGGVWKTTDSGKNWSNITDGYLKVGSVGAIEVAASDNNVMYVGTGSACPRGNISLGDGMYKSTNAGKSWKHIGLPNAGLIGDLIVDPRNPDRLYVAALGNIFGPNEQRGVFRSEDGGESWEKVLFASDSTGAVDLAINPNNPRVMYAAMWRAERKPWTLIDGGSEGGVWKTSDGGDSWEKLTNGLPDGKLGRIGVTVSSANPDRVWVLLEADKEKEGGLYRSDDGGQIFKRINGSHKLRARAWYYTHVFADPQDAETVYIANGGFYKSMNGGKEFERVDTPHGDNHALWINPHDNDIMIEGNDGGANVSKNGGQTWSTQRNQPTAEFYRLTVDNQFPYRVYGAQQDNSTISVPSKMPGDVSPEQYWYSVGGAESGDIAIQPGNPNVVYAGAYSAVITRKNLKTGRSLEMTPYPHYTEGTNMSDLKYRFQWNYPIVISKHGPDTMYVTSQYVHRSTNGGFSWKVISPDLTTNNSKYLDRIPGGPIQHDATGVEVYDSIFSFAESPQKRGVLWAGSDDGLVHISRDGGDSWEDITPTDMPKGGTVNSIDLSNHQSGTAYIAVYKYREADFYPYIFKTENYGKSWNKLTNGNNGIPNDHFVRVVREDPNQEGLLYAGTEYGMYISFDDGQHWQSFQSNLPHTPITDVEIQNKDLVLSTQGRSFWVLDDLSPLYQLDDQVEKSTAHLFRPSNAYRTQLRGYGGNPGPDAYPTGALIYFYLSDQAVNKTVKLNILNKQGQVIRRFSTEVEGKDEVDKLKVSEGLNRFEWNLNYDGPFVVEDLVRSPSQGPEAVPDNYQVRLQVGDYEQEQHFSVKADPRWNVTTRDLREAHALSAQVAGMINDLQHVIEKLRSVHSQINSIVDRTTTGNDSGEIQEKAEELNQDITDLLDHLINNNIKTGGDIIGMERKLSQRMGRLYRVVRGHDAKPTAGMKERLADIKKAYDGYMAQYKTLKNEDLSAFNNMLDEKEIRHVIVD